MVRIMTVLRQLGAQMGRNARDGALVAQWRAFFARWHGIC